MRRIIHNARVLSGSDTRAVTFLIRDGVIEAILPGDASGVPGEFMDAGGALAVAGMTDLHIHGANGHDLMEATEEAFQRVSEQCARTGVTRFLPTTVSAPYEDQMRFIGAALRVAGRERGARIAGLHLEGPYLNPARRGMQKQDHLSLPDIPEMARALDAAQGMVRMVTLAPELPGGLEMVRFLRDRGVVVAVAHSDASYDEACAAFDAGASHITHCFNAMPPLHHRDPGLLGAALERPEVSVQAIVDGIHLHPAVVRLLHRVKGPGGMALITDAMQAMGVGDGVYRFGGHDVRVEGGVARLSDGTLASSTVTLSRSLRLCRDFGIPLADAAVMASRTPAEILGTGDHGRLEEGCRADIILLNEDLTIRRVLIGGVPWDAGAPSAG